VILYSVGMSVKAIVRHLRDFGIWATSKRKNFKTAYYAGGFSPQISYKFLVKLANSY